MRGRLGRSGGGQDWGCRQGGHPVDGGQSRRCEKRWYPLLAAGQGREAEGGR